MKKHKIIPLNQNRTLYHLNLDKIYMYIFNNITRTQGIKLTLKYKLYEN